jgi:hypothetical protein
MFLNKPNATEHNAQVLQKESRRQTRKQDQSSLINQINNKFDNFVVLCLCLNSNADGKPSRDIATYNADRSTLLQLLEQTTITAQGKRFNSYDSHSEHLQTTLSSEQETDRSKPQGFHRCPA